MLTDKDIDKLIAVVATKQDVARLEERTQRIEDILTQVLTVLDRLARSIDDLTLEYAAVRTQLTRHEKWIRQIAKKAGVTLTDD